MQVVYATYTKHISSIYAPLVCSRKGGEWEVRGGKKAVERSINTEKYGVDYTVRRTWGVILHCEGGTMIRARILSEPS